MVPRQRHGWSLVVWLTASAAACSAHNASDQGPTLPSATAPAQAQEPDNAEPVTAGNTAGRQAVGSPSSTGVPEQDKAPGKAAGRAADAGMLAESSAGMAGSGADAALPDRSTPAESGSAPETTLGAETSPAVRCADVKTAPAGAAMTAYPGGRWSVPEPAYGMLIERNIRIRMSDGIELVGDVAYPSELDSAQRAAGKFPVLLTQNPYGSGTFGAEYGEIFVTHGYIFASVDVRGCDRSQGEHDMFSPREADDGAELVAWAAALDGSDGTVGLQGCSQLGINQLETATRLGPDSPVKAMIPACASGDFYRDTAFDNGIPTIVGAALAAPDAADGGDMAYYREYWKTRDRLARAPAIARADIPMLLWSGWHEPGALGSLELYTALQNLAAGRPVTTPITADLPVSGRYQVILGDWMHAGGLDLGLQLQWYDTWIKGVDTGLPTDTQTPLHLAELGGTKRWINARCYPLTERYTPLYFASDGALAATAEPNAGEDELGWVEPGLRSDVLSYTTQPFDAGALLAGPLAAQLVVSSSNANIQLVVDLYDSAPSGELSAISHGSILGTLRGTDPDKSWVDEAGLPARPYLTLDRDEALMAGEPTRLELPLWPTLWSIEPGHSLVVQITTQPDQSRCLDPLGVPVGCYPSTPMLNSLRGGSYRLHHGGELRSFISLPWLDHGALSTAASALSPTGAVSGSGANAVEYPLPTEW